MAVDPQDLAAGLIVLGVILSALELVVPGFVILPFGLGAMTAGIVGLIGVDTPLAQLIIFIAASLGYFLALRPLARRLDSDSPQDGIGASRLIGSEGVVLEDIEAGDTGLVRIEREEWRAESASSSRLIMGTRVRVTDMRGTRVVVETLPAQPPLQSPSTPPERPPVQ